jgi:hypothetical protein
LFDGVAEPDLDRCHIGRALKDEGAFVGAQREGPKDLELVDRSAVLRFL